MLDPADLQRLLGDLAREGVVESIDLEAGTARVQLGDMTTADLPWLCARAGATRIYSPPSVGEQVVILSPEGRSESAIILGSLSCDAHPHPATDTSTLAVFGDDARIGYDPEAHALTIRLPAGATIALEAPGGATWKGDLRLDGDLSVTGTARATVDVVGASKSLKDHVHTGVQAGGAVSGKPQ